MQQIPVSQIYPNPQQPRTYFERTSLHELAQSIKEHGVIQPIEVEEHPDGGYILHAGERRWRAAQLAKLTTIPAIVVPGLNGTGPRERLERALVENIQRVDMSPVEEGRAYKTLKEEHGMRVKDIAKRTGKHRTRIEQLLKLAGLEPEIQEMMLARKLPQAENKLVTAMYTIPEGEERIGLMRELATRRATAEQIILACRRYLSARGTGEKPPKKSVSPAVEMAMKYTAKEERPEWNALFQLDKVPPWPLVNDAILDTCDRCPLQDIASEVTCRECGLVAMVRTLLEAA